MACKKLLLQLFYRRTSHLRKYLRIWDAAVGGSLPSRRSNAFKYLVPTSSKRRRSVFSSLFAHLLTIGKDFVLLDYRVKLSHFPVLLQISHSLGLLRAAGEQISQVSRVHVESTVVGHGGCSYHGHRTGQWWGKDYEKKILLSSLLSFILWLVMSEVYILLC